MKLAGYDATLSKYPKVKAHADRTAKALGSGVKGWRPAVSAALGHIEFLKRDLAMLLLPPPWQADRVVEEARTSSFPLPAPGEASG